MTETDLESLSIEELEQLGYELLRQEEAVFERRKAVRAVHDKKLSAVRLTAKLKSVGVDATVIANVIKIGQEAKEARK